ncbi:MAG TPA: hypothetical protein ENJ59_01630 [Thermofilum sp.]|nr:hypothetical protein [Thermofilum sp.]
MLNNFNLVISTYRGRENDCISEFWYIMRELGDKKIDASLTGLPGLIVARTSLNPIEVVEKLKKEAEEKPWFFRVILKIVPVEVNVKAEVEEIVDAAIRLAKSKIGENETFRVTIRKRLSDIDRMELIEKIAEKIENRVDLNNPDKIVWVEIIGDVAGVSVLKPEHVLSVQIIRRQHRLRGKREFDTAGSD